MCTSAPPPRSSTKTNPASRLITSSQTLHTSIRASIPTVHHHLGFPRQNKFPRFLCTNDLTHHVAGWNPNNSHNIAEVFLVWICATQMDPAQPLTMAADELWMIYLYMIYLICQRCEKKITHGFGGRGNNQIQIDQRGINFPKKKTIHFFCYSSLLLSSLTRTWWGGVYT